MERKQRENASKHRELKETEIEMHTNKGNVITKCNVCTERVSNSEKLAPEWKHVFDCIATALFSRHSSSEWKQHKKYILKMKISRCFYFSFLLPVLMIHISVFTLVRHLNASLAVC